MKSTAIIITAIVCISLLEGIAILTHSDGAFFGVVIASVAGLGGYQVGLNTPVPSSTETK